MIDDRCAASRSRVSWCWIASLGSLLISYLLQVFSQVPLDDEMKLVNLTRIHVVHLDYSARHSQVPLFLGYALELQTESSWSWLEQQLLAVVYLQGVPQFFSPPPGVFYVLEDSKCNVRSTAVSLELGVCLSQYTRRIIA